MQQPAQKSGQKKVQAEWAAEKSSGAGDRLYPGGTDLSGYADHYAGGKGTADTGIEDVSDRQRKRDTAIER